MAVIQSIKLKEVKASLKSKKATPVISRSKLKELKNTNVKIKKIKHLISRSKFLQLIAQLQHHEQTLEPFQESTAIGEDLHQYDEKSSTDLEVCMNLNVNRRNRQFWGKRVYQYT